MCCHTLKFVRAKGTTFSLRDNLNTLFCQLRLLLTIPPKESRLSLSPPNLSLLFLFLVSFLYLSFPPGTKTTLLCDLKLLGFFFQCFILGGRRIKGCTVLIVITTNKSANTQTPPSCLPMIFEISNFGLAK